MGQHRATFLGQQVGAGNRGRVLITLYAANELVKSFCLRSLGLQLGIDFQNRVLNSSTLNFLRIAVKENQNVTASKSEVGEQDQR